MTKMTGSSSDHGLGGTSIALCEGISPSPLKAIESSNIVFILAIIFLCAYFLRIYLSKLLSPYHLKQHSDHRTTKLAVSSSTEHGLSGSKYDVFISFRGADTSNNFVSHLYDALLRKKIKAYKDNVSLPGGEELSPALYKAIEGSKISIVVLSENYATSRWCLDELVHILKCKRERGQIVFAVFYGVDRSDVGEQKKIYASAFVKHEESFEDRMERVLRWRSALKEAGNDLTGWESNQNRSEFELVEEIAQVILLKLYNLSSSSYDDINRNLVGMEERLKKIESLLRFDSPEVRVIGIWGMGCIGKSTLAEVVQNRFSLSFDSCFYIDVSNALKHCQLRDINEKLVASLLKDKDVDMTSSFKFDRLRRSKVFLVLDNVDDFEQLEHLIGFSDQTKNRFGKGSRIIITSRDKKLLMESADDIHEVNALELDEATELFYQSAFRRDLSRIMEYTELSKKFVSYAGGNPLALKVLGSHLHSRSVKEWESALSKLRKSPHEKVQNVLKISYDALDHVEQSIFLDIACFHKGEDREFIEDILGDYSHISINILIERSLITTNSGQIWMHDLIQEMAWEIVRQESEVLGQRSRLWDARDVYSLLKINKLGSARIKGMRFDLSKISNDLCLSSTVFEALQNLRFLKIYYSHFDRKKFVYFNQGLCYLPDSIRYLHWEEYPLKSLPLTFKPQNLVKLNMSRCKLEKLWNGVQDLGNLKHIDLSWSRDLIEVPDLSRAPRLEHVDLNFCQRLEHVDLGFCQRLEHVDLGFCQRLTSLPMLPRNVRTLNLCYCKTTLSVSAWPVLLGLHSLTELRMSGCGISDIPESFNLLSSLETLDMRKNDFQRIPSSIKKMNKLKDLNISNCNNLESLPDLPSSLKSLEAKGCESLRMISVCGLTSLECLNASECKALEEFIIDETSLEAMDQYFGSQIRFYFGNCLKLKQGSQDNICTLFQRQMLVIRFLRGFDVKFFSGYNNNRVYYCGNEIPKWFTCESEGSLIHSVGHDVTGISVSIVHELEVPNYLLPKAQPHLRIWIGPIKLMDCRFPMVSLHFNGERLRPHVYMWHFYFSKAEKELLDSVTEASFEFNLTDYHSGAEIKIKKMGIRLIYLEKIEEYNLSWQKVDQTSPKPDEAPYSRSFKRKREEYGADTGATTSSPADAEEALSSHEKVE